MFGRKNKSTSSATSSPWGEDAASDSGDNLWGKGDMPPSDGPSDRPSQSDRPPESPREDRPPARESVPRNITELVEPLFVVLCRVHRRKQAGEDLSYHKLRQETEQVISRVEK